MEFDIEYNAVAFIGILFGDKVIFNVINNDADFLSTGVSIIHHLKTDKNKFVSKIIESQSYNGIKYIFDDEILFEEIYSKTNENSYSFNDIMKLIIEDNVYEYFYILDYSSNTILIKIPEVEHLTNIDYTNSTDVRNFINKVKRG